MHQIHVGIQFVKFVSLAVSIMLYTVALASAPRFVSLKSQFFLPTANGRIAFSARLLDSSVPP
jgi:hypothetical protein